MGRNQIDGSIDGGVRTGRDGLDIDDIAGPRANSDRTHDLCAAVTGCVGTLGQRNGDVLDRVALRRERCECSIFGIRARLRWKEPAFVADDQSHLTARQGNGYANQDGR